MLDGQHSVPLDAQFLTRALFRPRQEYFCRDERRHLVSREPFVSQKVQAVAESLQVGYHARASQLASLLEIRNKLFDVVDRPEQNLLLK